MKYNESDAQCAVLLFSQGVNGDVNLNGGKDSNEFADDDSYPTLTISTENDQQEDSCCEVFDIVLFLISLFFGQLFLLIFGQFAEKWTF